MPQRPNAQVPDFWRGARLSVVAKPEIHPQAVLLPLCQSPHPERWPLAEVRAHPLFSRHEEKAMPIDSELLWLLPRVIRMRALLRYAKDDLVKTSLMDLITDVETRLEALEEMAREDKNPDYGLGKRPGSNQDSLNLSS